MKKYHSTPNWASALVDITIIISAVVLKNYWLLLLLVLTGSYKIPLMEEE